MDNHLAERGQQALATLLDRVRHASHAELPALIDQTTAQISKLLAHQFIDAASAEATQVESRRIAAVKLAQQTPSAPPELSIGQAIALCQQNYNDLSYYEKDFIPGLHRFRNLSAAQLRCLRRTAAKFGVVVSDQH
jgi:hypothetical protein